MTLKEMIRRAAPPAFLDLSWKRRGAGGVSGDFASWDEALAASTGYDNPAILQKTKAALLKVRDGHAAYERDSVLFDRVEYSWPVLAGLLWAAARSGGELNVLDFGGSLGSSYFQSRAFLSGLRNLRWNIVEQPAHVAEGKKSFENEQLRFFRSIGECVSDTAPNAVLLSGVLQYLERPYDVLASLLALRCTCVIIDRTPFWAGNRDKLGVQRVDPVIFDATIPSWVFSRSKFDAALQQSSTVVAEFASLDSGAGLEYKGFITCPSAAATSRRRSR